MSAIALSVTSLLLSFVLSGSRAQDKVLLRMEPGEFWKGELKRLAPHLGVTGVCFKLSGPAVARCEPRVEMWCDGQEVMGGGYGWNIGENADEVTFSFKRTKSKDGEFYWDCVVGGARLFSRSLREPTSKQKVESEFGPLPLLKPIELKEEGASAVVFAIGAGKGASLSNPEEVEKMLKTAPWALVLRLTLVKERKQE